MCSATNDGVERGLYYEIVAQRNAALSEVSRLRAELAAERERLLNMHVSLIRLLEKRCDDAEEMAAIQSEIDKLRERLGPRGLVVVMIDGSGHYVSEMVAAEIERLTAELAAALNALAAERTLREHETKRANDNYESLTKHWLKEGKLRELLTEIVEYTGYADHALADEYVVARIKEEIRGE